MLLTSLVSVGLITGLLIFLRYNSLRSAKPNQSGTRSVSAGNLPAGWTVLKETTPDRVFFDAECASTTECWVVGGPPMESPGDGFILHTTDAGATWSETAPFEGYAYSIDYKAPNMLGVAGRYGKIYLSNDGGATWTTKNPTNNGGAENTPIYKFAWEGATDAWATANRQIYHSIDNGANWSAYYILNQTVPFGLDCATESNCIASGTGGKAYRTTDRGATWIDAFPQGYWNHTLDVAFPAVGKGYLTGGDDTNTTYTTGTGGVVFSTTNGGVNWTPITIPQSGDIPSIRCLNENDCAVLSADNAKVHRTLDGGTNWMTADLGYANTMLNMEYFDDNHLLVVGKGIIVGYGMASGGAQTGTPTPTPTTDPAAPTPTRTPTVDPNAPTPTRTATPIPGQATATPSATIGPQECRELLTETSCEEIPSCRWFGCIFFSITKEGCLPRSMTPAEACDELLFGPSPTGQTNTTLSPSPSGTPSPTSLPTATYTPSETPTATPIPTATPTPILASFCDTTCGSCGWRDTDGVCHPEGKIDGSGDACCYRTCVGRRCTMVSGYGTEGNCTQDSQCQEDRIASVPTATPKTILTSLPQTGQGTSPTRPAGVTSVTPGGGSAPVAGDARWLFWIIVPVVIILGAVMM